MKINKVETIGIFLSVAVMALVLSYLRFSGEGTPVAAVNNNAQQAVVVASTEGDQNLALAEAVVAGAGEDGSLERLIVDDITVGNGAQVDEGDIVTVNYIGRLQNGQEFDNSYDNGRPFTFEVGKGAVIKGWDLGLVGMKVGGERILVIPPEFGYGAQGFGPIPGDATLVFAIELLEVK